MIITYSRPESLGQALDPEAPALDLSSTGTTCGATTYDRAIGVDLDKIRSAVLDLFWEGDADDVQLVASTAHDTARTRAAVAELVDLAQRGHEDFEHHAGHGDDTAADINAARVRWHQVQQLTAELTRHVAQG